MNKILNLIKLTRPLNFAITFFSIIVGAVLCINGEYSSIKIVLAAISGGLTASSGNVINDIYDLEIDKINRPDRPLSGGKLKLKEAKIFYVILNLLAIILSYLVNLNAFIIVLAAIILLIFYSYQLKGIPILGNFIVSLMTGLAFIFGGVSVNNYSYAIIPALFAFLINFIREIVKDIEDIEGDSKMGVSTFPSRFGIKASQFFVLALSILLIAATFYPFVFHIYKIEYFIIVMAIVNSLLVYIVKSLFENVSIKNLNKLSFLLKLDMILGLIAIYLGK